MPAYEYLSVGTVLKSNWADIASLPEASRPQVTYKTHAYIWRPGARVAEERELDDRGVLPVYNELGRDGWRLVDRLVTHTTVDDFTHANVIDWYGHKREIGTPLGYAAVFVREPRP